MRRTATWPTLVLGGALALAGAEQRLHRRVGFSVVGFELPAEVLGGVFGAFDLDAVAARRDVHAQPVFDRYQIAVIFAE